MLFGHVLNVNNLFRASSLTRNGMFRALLFISLVILTNSVYAQVGRVEVTIDTVPVGGDQQRESMAAMEAHDRLTKELVLLRDSIQSFLTTQNQNTAAYKTASTSEVELSQMISLFKRSEQSAGLYRKGSELLDKKRSELNSLRRK